MGTFYILCRFYFSFFPGFSSSTIKMKQMLLAALAVSALCVATAAPFRDAAIASRVAELTDEEANEAYGLMELIPGVFDMIEKLRPVIEENFQILLDPNMNQKINEIMKVCLQRAPEVVAVVGDFGLKVIVQAILPGIIAAMGAAGR